MAGPPLALPAWPQTGLPASSLPGPCLSSQPACLGPAGAFLLVSVPAGLPQTVDVQKLGDTRQLRPGRLGVLFPVPFLSERLPKCEGWVSDLQTLSIPFLPLPVRTLSQDSSGQLFGKQLAQLGCSQGHWGSPKGDSDPQGHPGPEAGQGAGTSRICSGSAVTAELLDLLAKGLQCPACCVQMAAGNVSAISSGL